MANGSDWWGVILIEGIQLLALFGVFFFPLMQRNIRRKNLATCHLQVAFIA